MKTHSLLPPNLLHKGKLGVHLSKGGSGKGRSLLDIITVLDINLREGRVEVLLNSRIQMSYYLIVCEEYINLFPLIDRYVKFCL